MNPFMNRGCASCGKPLAEGWVPVPDPDCHKRETGSRPSRPTPKRSLRVARRRWSPPEATRLMCRECAATFNADGTLKGVEQLLAEIEKPSIPTLGEEVSPEKK